MSEESKLKYKDLVKQFQETFSGKDLNKSIVSNNIFLILQIRLVLLKK